MSQQLVRAMIILARDQDYQAAQSFRWTSFRTRDESAATTGTIVWKIGGFEKEILGKASLHEGVNSYIGYIFNIKR